MSVRYYSEFEQYNTRPDKRSVDLIRIELSDSDYSGDPQPLQMGATPLEITYSEASSDKAVTIVGSQASFQLLVTDEFELSDLYTDQEMKWGVNIKRNGSTIWRGFVIPDGCSERFVDPPYIVNVRSVDGLGVLKNIPYSPSDEKKSVLKVISECLFRTSLDMPINTFSLLEYEGMSLNSDVFNETYVWASRFYKDDINEIPMSCAEALESLLEGWGCSVIQSQGEWWIVNITDLSISGGIFESSRYTPEGVYIERVSHDRNILLGNNEGDVIHRDYDQIRSIEKPYKKLSIRYTYGAINDILNYNQRFLKSEGLISFEFSEWDKAAGLVADPSPAFVGEGVPAVIYGKNVGVVQGSFLGLKNFPSVSSLFKLRLEVTFNAGSANGLPFVLVWAEDLLSDQYTLDADNTWKLIGSADAPIHYFYDYTEKTNSQNETFTWGKNRVSKGSIEFEVPGDGIIRILLFPAFYMTSNSSRNIDSGRVELYEVSLKPVVNEEESLSEIHTVTNNANFTYTPSEINVVNGDSNFYAFRGSMFKSDQDTLTSKWRKKGTVDYFSFLRISATDIMKRRGRPMNLYEGSIYGYFDYFSIFTINHLSGKFIVISATYNIKENKTNVVLLEIDHQDVPSQYALTYDKKELPTAEITKI